MQIIKLLVFYGIAIFIYFPQISLAAPLPTTSSDGNSTLAEISIHTYLTNDSHQAEKTTFTQNERITITAQLTPETKDVGKQADIYIVAMYNNSFLMKTNSNNWESWNINLLNLTPANTLQLNSSENIDIISGLTGMIGEFMIYLGYRNSTSSNTIYNTIGHSFSVSNTSSNSPTNTYPIVDTNQSRCFDAANGSEIICTGNKYDADYVGLQPNYSVESAIITDNITELMWTKSSDIDNDGVTTDVDDKLSQVDAINYCNDLTLDNYDDWRLPDIKTLYSLILFSGKDASTYLGSNTSGLVTFLDTNFSPAFGDQSAGERIIDGQYATITNYVSTTMNNDATMFGVNFIDGRIKGYPLYNKQSGAASKFYVLCVRGNETYGINQFVDNSDGTVSDQATQLIWQQNDTQSANFEDAITICENATTASQNDWRLPNAKELHSILDYSRSPDTTNSAAINPVFYATAFTNEEGETDWGYYWSSTTHKKDSGDGSLAAYLSFGRALGRMQNTILDAHGAGAQRSNEKQSEQSRAANSATDTSGETYYYKGPQGDIVRIDNWVRCVRDMD